MNEVNRWSFQQFHDAAVLAKANKKNKKKKKSKKNKKKKKKKKKNKSKKKKNRDRDSRIDGRIADYNDKSTGYNNSKSLSLDKKCVGDMA